MIHPRIPTVGRQLGLLADAVRHAAEGGMFGHFEVNATVVVAIGGVSVEILLDTEVANRNAALHRRGGVPSLAGLNSRLAASDDLRGLKADVDA